MRKSRYSEEQIIRVLRQVESGQKVKDVIREHGISEQTYYRWKSKYGGMDVSDAQRLKQLESENRRLKKLVAAESGGDERWIVEERSNLPLCYRSLGHF
jgi:putative transposase